MAASAQVLGRLHENPIRARQQEASEKRQGTNEIAGGIAGGAAGYGELARSGMVTMFDFGESKWLGRSAGG
jgi:hypothetical protein